jgi:hypothetical protein
MQQRMRRGLRTHLDVMFEANWQLGVEELTLLEKVERDGDMGWVEGVYGVELWLRCPEWSLWPEYFSGGVVAASPFAAVERLMRLVGVSEVAYASARRLDGSLVYRGFKITLFQEPEAVLTSEELVVFGEREQRGETW